MLPVRGLLVGAPLSAMVACSATPSSTPPSSSSRASLETVQRLSEPRAGRQEARFALESGAGEVVVRAGSIGDDLYRVGTPNGASVVPEADQTGGSVVLRLRASGAAGASAVKIELNGAVRWSLRLNGGTSAETVDMSAGRLGELTASAGSGRLELDLGPAHGSVPVRVSGGTGQLRLVPPRDVPIRLRVGGGAGRVEVDAQTVSGPGGPRTFADSGFDAAVDRYDVDVSAGVGNLVVTRR